MPILYDYYSNIIVILFFKMEVFIMAKSEQELLDAYKKRIKQQNKITATLPKGTIERIRAQGLTISEVVNKSVLEYLERLEGAQNTLK